MDEQQGGGLPPKGSQRVEESKSQKAEEQKSAVISIWCAECCRVVIRHAVSMDGDRVRGLAEVAAELLAYHRVQKHDGVDQLMLVHVTK